MKICQQKTEGNEVIGASDNLKKNEIIDKGSDEDKT